jgi:VWFA-related protein
MKRLPGVLWLLLALAVSSLAQTNEGPAKSSEQEPLKLQTNLVNLNVKVTDIGGRPLVDLQREDFLILENGETQEVAFFEPVSAPINLLLLLDMSGSTREKRKILLQAAKKFVDALGKEDRVAVAAFTRKFYLLSDFTGDHKQLKKRIDKAKDIEGGTAYYDAMWQTLDLLQSLKDSRKAIVVLTDGVDNSLVPNSSMNYQRTEHTFDDLLGRAEEDDATIYPIYLNTLAPPRTFAYTLLVPGLAEDLRTRYERDVAEARRLHKVARSQLEALAEATAGCLFAADSETDLEGVYQRVAAELHQFYSLAYAPKKDLGKGEYRKITIKVNREGARAQTRRGYYAK